MKIPQEFHENFRRDTSVVKNTAKFPDTKFPIYRW